MQKKDIKIGTAYAVTPGVGTRSAGTPGKATVTALNVEYLDRGSYGKVKRGGVEVTFDTPVVRVYNGWGDPARFQTATPKTKFVVSARHIAETWDDYQERQTEWARWDQIRAEKADADAEAFRPEYEALVAKLREHGFGASALPWNTATGTDGERKIIGVNKFGRVQLETETFLGLIGVGAPEGVTQ